MKLGEHIIGVCSWSLRPTDMRDLVAKVQSLGLAHAQLDLSWLMAMGEAGRSEAMEILKSSGLQLTAGMVHFNGEDYSSIGMIRKTGGFVPDALWEDRRQVCAQACELASRLQLQAISMHAGFIPASSDPGYHKIVERVSEVAKLFAERQVDVLLETGQETASDLLQFLNDLTQRNVHVNFDPANLILYGAGDPIEAISTLGRHIAHVHLKDANFAENPGREWGTEVAFGSGDVPVADLFSALHAVGYSGPFVIEREAGNERLDDILTAIETLREVL